MAWPCFTVTMLNLGSDKSEASTNFYDRRGQLCASWRFLLSKHWIKVLMVALWICRCFVVKYADSLMQLLTGTLQLQKKWQILSLPNACCLLTNAVVTELLRFLNSRIIELMLLPVCSYSISSKDLSLDVTKISP